MNLKTQLLVSLIITTIGILLMIFMIISESEPGAIPLLIIIFGAGWYFITKLKIRSGKT